MSKIKQYLNLLIDSFIGSLYGTIVLLLLLLLGLLLSLFIAKSMTINDYTLGLLNISFTLILVFITLIYVIFTGQIVRESKNAQKVAFIEKRLEKLYYPLKGILELNPKESTTEAELAQLRQINDLYRFQYLATDELKELLNKFINIKETVGKAI
ncbi:MAG: hypothetical protein JXA98_00025 [Methanosarcinaceae archaeon]|nr:hypothetical protein [Methanosarcinaceae archaeon]